MKFAVPFSIFCLSFGPWASAAIVMVQPTMIATSTTLFSAASNFDNVTDQSGLTETYVSRVTTLTDYLAAAPAHNGIPVNSNQLVLTETSGTFDFDLGVEVVVSDVVLWNTLGTANNRLANFTVTISESPTFSSPTSLGSFSTATTASTHPVPGETFAVATPTQGRYVRIEAFNAGGAHLTFGEIAFAGTVAVPEASALGFGLLGGLLGLRRRR